MYFTPASCARRTQASGNSRKGLDLLGGGGANEQGFEPGGRLAVVEFAQVEERLLAGVLGRKGVRLHYQHWEAFSKEKTVSWLGPSQGESAGKSPQPFPVKKLRVTKKEHSEPFQSAPVTTQTKLLFAQNRVFGGFGDAELHHLFSRDLDRGASGGIASHPGFAIDEH